MHHPLVQELDLGGHARLTDRSITVLAQNCRNLKTLVLNNIISITDASMFSLADGCKELSFLAVYDTEVSDEGRLALISGCDNIEVSGI